MNKEKELNRKLKNADLLVLSGSRLYGTDTPQSDRDYRGFIVPPFEYLVGLSKFDHQTIREPDSVIYSIRRFFELLLKGDPGTLEILFAPEYNIIEKTGIGHTVIHNRSIFVSKQFSRRIRGYAQSEWRKVTGTQLMPMKRTPTEDEVVENIRQTFGPNRETMDEVIRLLFLQHKREIRNATNKLGAKRKQQIDKYGYCTSSASHAVRLLEELTELLVTGKITFPRPEAAILLSIKNGEFSLEEVTRIYNLSVSGSRVAETNSNLPDRAPVKRIQDLYHQIVSQKIRTDTRCRYYADWYLAGARHRKEDS